MVRWLQKHCCDFFLEIMWHYSEDEQFQFKQDEYLNRVADLHRATGIPMVLTNDCHFAYEQQEQILQGFLKRVHSKGELEFDGNGFFFQTQETMQGIADALGIPNAVANAREICE